VATSGQKVLQSWRLLFLTGSLFPPTVVASVKGLYPRCGGQMCSLEKAQYLHKHREKGTWMEFKSRLKFSTYENNTWFRTREI